MTALGAVGVFHLRGHEELRAAGFAGNHCALALALDGRLDLEALDRRVRALDEGMDELRRYPSLDRTLAPVWKDVAAGAPRLLVATSDLDGESELLDAAVRLVGEPLPTRATWQLHVLRGKRNDHVVFRWLHPLTDAHGATRLVASLGATITEPLPACELRTKTSDELLPAGMRERHAFASRYFRHVMRLASRPVVSACGPRAAREPGAMRAVRLRLSESESRAFTSSLRQRAKLSDTSVLLWASARMLDRVLLRRSLCPVHYLVHVPVSLDSKVERARMFGNNLSMMMLELDRNDLFDERRAVESLAAQRRDIVREKLDVAMLAALSVTRRLPAPLYSYGMRRPFGGERGSFVFSNPGVLDLATFGGRPVTDAFTVPAVLVPPGFQVIATRHAGRVSLTVLFVEAALSFAEARDGLPELAQDILAGC